MTLPLSRLLLIRVLDYLFKIASGNDNNKPELAATSM